MKQIRLIEIILQASDQQSNPLKTKTGETECVIF